MLFSTWALLWSEGKYGYIYLCYNYLSCIKLILLLRLNSLACCVYLGERERSTQIAMINDSNSKFVSNQGNAISRFQKDTSAQHKLWVGIFCFCDQESLN